MIPRAAAPSSSSSIANLSSRSIVRAAQGQHATARSFATVQENAPPVHHHGGLKDQDRIFTNLYGHHGADLKSAMKYGDWYRTKDMVLKGHDWVRILSPEVLPYEDAKKKNYQKDWVRWMVERKYSDCFAAYFGNQGLRSSWSRWCWFPVGIEIRKWWRCNGPPSFYIGLSNAWWFL